MDNDVQLRELGIEGYIFLKIRASDTEFNQRIHDAFRELARVECKNDYTLALGKLLEYYQADAKTEMLFNDIARLQARVEDLEAAARKLVAPVTSNAAVTNPDSKMEMF